MNTIIERITEAIKDILIGLITVSYTHLQDDCIRKNPFEFKLSDVLEDDTEQKVILTPEQEERLLAFMEKDKIYSKYYDEVVLLLDVYKRQHKCRR